MKLFNFINRNHQAADAWRKTLLTRENKKGGQPVTGKTFTTKPLQAIQNFHQQHVICTAEALKKTAEEKLQIQQVHDELEKIRILPELAI